MFRFFGNKRYFSLFFDLDKKHIKDLAKKHGTVSHLSNVTDQLAREGLIAKKINGRETEIELTEDGKEFQKILRIFYNFAEKQSKKIKLEEVK